MTCDLNVTGLDYEMKMLSSVAVPENVRAFGGCMNSAAITPATSGELRITVWTEVTKVVRGVVQTVAVNVVEYQGEWQPLPDQRFSMEWTYLDVAA